MFWFNFPKATHEQRDRIVLPRSLLQALIELSLFDSRCWCEELRRGSGQDIVDEQHPSRLVRQHEPNGRSVDSDGDHGHPILRR